ncbi:uncharacterized protein LOC144639381 [Oculina patagonica]
MPPKKRPYPTRSNAKRARPRLSEMAETRPDKSKSHEVGQEEQQEQPHMAVNLTALSASISVAVKQAVVEALGEKTQTVQSTTPASATEQSVVDEVVNVSLAGITQDSTLQGTFTPGGQITDHCAREPFADELVANLESLLSSVLSSGSCQSYRRAWTLFREFHATFYKTDAVHLPLSTASLALFISFLDGKKLSPATILSYLSAIGYVHKMKGLRDPTKAFLIQKLLTSLSRRKSSDVRLPISKPILHDLVNSLQRTNSSAAQRVLFSAMFLTAFYGFFRISELAAKSARSNAVIQYDNLRLLKSAGKIHSIKITITHFKHNINNRPVDIIITGDNTLQFCPVKSLLQYCEMRGDKPGPLFCHLDNSPILVTQFNTELRRCLNFCGLDPQRYKSHSFRIGAACLAADKGFSDAQIRALGRWKSDAFKLYIRNSTLQAI